ncbi:hypothetical protein X797_007497 [Metarhizium robertsii]|uniref:Uncharacterized protein n=2 Tax=Metarhizium robertsii TaxID=568076 RepID=E9F5N0_METRA|nr:uncharacterized protein MAA_07579 [Metarhizium robertsii ARSEF 23]EFY97033.1 hypothetical protein MAA_07579 [Metarhizium robertsii ARSEF 23]EXU99361.1 hypothetical protein X797_007497 [Metarhizium robertsii]
MTHKEDRPYFLYSTGYPTEELCLGHLSFGSYSKPTSDSRWHSSIGKLRFDTARTQSETDLENWAYITELGPFTYESKPSVGVAVDLNVLEIVTLGSSFRRSQQTLVHAKRGRRIKLRDPHRFLLEKVLASQSVKDSLERWLILSKFGVKKRIVRPKIWYLTGLYELQDATSTTIDTRDVSLQAGISPELVAALSGPPVGPGTEIEWGASKLQCTQGQGRQVWAAMYQLLDARYFRLKENEPKPSVSIALSYKPIWSDGDLRGADAPEVEDCVELALQEPQQDVITGDTEEETELYWQPLLEAQERWEEAAKWAD